MFTFPALMLLASALSASAETLMMPKRDAVKGENVVVWGVTTVAGATYRLQCGNGTEIAAGTAVPDRSYLPLVCNYATAGVKTATLTVQPGNEVATVEIAVYDPLLLAPDALRNLRVNMAIEDGLRNLWFTQDNRTADFPAGVQTSWGSSSGFTDSHTALVTLAFENHGYTLPSNPAVAPTGLYEKYIVRRGLNYVIASLKTVAIGVTPQGDNPCVGVAADTCTGLYAGRSDDFHQSYTTGVAILPLAASGSLARTVALADVPGNVGSNYVSGKTYGDILQRMVNALAWGQIDATAGASQGGWYYDFNSFSGDGSTMGWDILALLDAEAAGAVVPSWVKTEFGGAGNVLDNQLNADGSFDYQTGQGFDSSSGPQKTGIGLQGLYLIGQVGTARANLVRDNINSWWNGATGGIGGNNWGCAVPGVFYPNDTNKGCAYSMYNNFKGLKLHGISTLPNVARGAGPGAIPANDWYADYVDWALANQSAPTTTSGGSWGPAMGFSCCMSSDVMETAIIELILSPVALVLPDEEVFGQFGLSHVFGQHNPPVTTATNPAGTSHTVYAHAESTNGTPVGAATVIFKIISGPNTGLVADGQDITDSSGNAHFTYTDVNAGGGNDVIQAFIGGIGSNQVTKTWTAEQGLVCDVNATKTVTLVDLQLIRAKNGQLASGSGDPFDANKDGRINLTDVAFCQRRLTP